MRVTFEDLGSEAETIKYAKQFLKQFDGKRITAFQQQVINSVHTADYWKILVLIDGAPHPDEDSPSSRKARRIAREQFTVRELQDLLTLAINNALYSSHQSLFDGFNIPHTKLFEHLVGKTESNFNLENDRDLFFLTQNMRFYESIPRLGTTLCSAHFHFESVLETEFLFSKGATLKPTYYEKGAMFLNSCDWKRVTLHKVDSDVVSLFGILLDDLLQEGSPFEPYAKQLVRLYVTDVLSYEEGRPKHGVIRELLNIESVQRYFPEDLARRRDQFIEIDEAKR